MLKRYVTFVVLALLIVPQFVTAETMTEYTVDLDYRPTGDNDGEQNRLDPDAETCRDTWDPVPTGVFVGGFSKESSLRLSLVPDTNCSVALAQVLRFDASQIMSGSSYFVVRLPMRTPETGKWSSAYVSIYRISADSNWTFESNLTFEDGTPHKYNNMRINFTAGDQHLVYWSREISPSDSSPTDGDDHFSRSNRTYLMASAPIYPDVYYLIVTMVKYASDRYVDVYWQPESLTLGAWNRSTLATYNQVAPDSYVLSQENFNISLGYSFDFRHGFAQGMSGWNKWIDDGDQLSWLMKLEDVDLDQYLTFMWPFWSTTANLSVRVEVLAFNFTDAEYESIIDDNSEWNDFILLSTTAALSTILTDPWCSDWAGWCKVRLSFGNDTRLRIFTRDLEFQSPTGFNGTWLESGLYVQALYIHAPNWSYDPLEYILWNDTLGLIEAIHWCPQASLQLNDYYWSQSAPQSVHMEQTKRSWENMTLVQKSFYVFGRFLITMGEVVTPVIPPLGYAVTAAGMAAVMVAEYANLPDPLGWLSDGLNWAWDKLQGFGQWLWKVGQRIYGAISWFVEQLIYYGSIILGMLILILAFIVLFTPMYFTVKVAVATRKAMLGDFQGATEELKGAAATAGKLVRRRPT